MKNATIIFMAFLSMSIPSFSQPQPLGNGYDLIYDYSESKKQWSGTIRDGRFIARHKTQQRITFINVPEGVTVEVKQHAINITPTVDTKENYNGGVKTAIYLSDVIDSDAIEYEVNFKDKSGNLLYRTTAFVKAFGGLKIDLSTGVVLHTIR